MLPIEPSTLNGKRIALVLTDAADESAVFTGIGRWDGNTLVMLRNAPDPAVEIRQEWYSKIRPTPDASKDALLGADFFIGLQLGALPKGSDESRFQKIGLKWPD
jgi:hypothetical protein